MRSTLSATTGYGSAEKMFQHLVRQVPNNVSGNALGIFTCSPDVSHASLVRRLQAHYPFPIIGGTTLADPFTPREADVAASLVVIGRPDIKYAISVSEPVDESICRGRMDRLYRDCVAKLEGESPKLFMIIMPILPNLHAERYLPDIFELAGEVPVFGGMVSDDFNSDQFAVFVDGEAYQDRMVLVGLGGDVRPVFGTGFELTVLSDYSPTVTETEGNVVKRVDDIRFCDYLRKVGFPDGDEVISDFPMYIKVRGRLSERDGIAEACALIKTNPEDGSGSFSSAIPEGCKIDAGFLTKEDVIRSTRLCLDELLGKMRSKQENGYVFSAVFCLTCIARYFAMMGHDNIESELLGKKLPDSLSLYGYYGFNEICPTTDKRGMLFNRSHSDSIVLCAF